MDSARLPDTDLLQLVREGGEFVRPALHQLKQRHFHAVRGFAAAWTVNRSAADEVAGRSWHRALRSQEGSAIGAVRPHALTVVLRTAADFVGAGHGKALDYDLATWVESQPPEYRGDPAAPHVRHSVTARAFGSLPGSSQTVLWHDAVEHDDGARIGLLLGANPEEMPILNRRARREFYSAYIQIHQDGMPSDECRNLHRMVLAYADARNEHAAGDIFPHLEGCAHCSGAVTDLRRMRMDCGALLSESLLPWGGQEYAASSSRATSPGSLQVHAGAPAAPAVPATMDVGDVTTVSESPGAVEPARNRSQAATTGTFGKLRFRPEGGGLARKLRRKRLTQSAAFLGICSLAVAFAYTGGNFSAGPAQGSGPASVDPGARTPAADGPSTPAKKPSKSPSPGKKPPKKSKPPAKGGGGGGGGDDAPPESTPEVRGASLKWTFNKINGGVAPDSSGNSADGFLLGDPEPEVLSSGALNFFGSQSVTGDGPVVDTAKSFSVSARVKLEDNTDFNTVLSQDGFAVSAFQLQYDPDQDRWEMRMTDDDFDEDSPGDEAVSDTRPQLGKWTRLTGVYDAGSDEIRLYVNGKLEDVSFRSGFDAIDGDFAVGRSLEGDAFTRGFVGEIDDVSAFPRALSSSDIQNLGRG